MGLRSILSYISARVCTATKLYLSLTQTLFLSAMTRDIPSGRVLLIGACVPWKDIVAQIKKVRGPARSG